MSHLYQLSFLCSAAGPVSSGSGIGAIIPIIIIVAVLALGLFFVFGKSGKNGESTGEVEVIAKATNDEDDGGLLFGNIGRKIKAVVKVSFWLVTILFVLAGVIMMTAADSEILVGIGVLLFLAGPFVSWLSSLALYGLGQLIENSDKVARAARILANDKEMKIAAKPFEAEADSRDNIE